MPGSSSLPDFYHTGTRIHDTPKSYFDPKKAKIKVIKPDDVSESNSKSKVVDESSAHGFQWHTGPVRKGDVVIFDSHIIHGAGKNLTKRFRCSMDIRFVLAPSLQSSSRSSSSSSSSSSSGTSGLTTGLKKTFKESSIARFLSTLNFKTLN